MEKKPLLSKPLKFLKNEGWKPYVRYQKETDTWIAKAIREKPARDEEMEETVGEIISKIRILMDKPQLDIISRIVAYMYHDKKDEFEEIASDMRKEHIYKDLRSIDMWLNSQYKRLESEDEQSEQNQGEHL